MKLHSQRLARRLTVLLGLPLLPIACFGFCVTAQKISLPGPCDPLVNKFLRAAQSGDWGTAASCYGGAPELRRELVLEVGPIRGPIKRHMTAQSWPFFGKREIYDYDAICDRGRAEIFVEVIRNNDTPPQWKIDNVSCSPPP